MRAIKIAIVASWWMYSRGFWAVLVASGGQYITISAIVYCIIMMWLTPSSVETEVDPLRWDMDVTIMTTLHHHHRIFKLDKALSQ